MSSKTIAYTTTQARERREQLRRNCLNEAIRSTPVGFTAAEAHYANVLNAAKAFELYITTGKLKTK